MPAWWGNREAGICEFAFDFACTRAWRKRAERRYRPGGRDTQWPAAVSLACRLLTAVHFTDNAFHEAQPESSFLVTGFNSYGEKERQSPDRGRKRKRATEGDRRKGRGPIYREAYRRIVVSMRNCIQLLTGIPSRKSFDPWRQLHSNRERYGKTAGISHGRGL